MTTKTDDLTATQLEAFDEFVQRIGLENEWDGPDPHRQQTTYAALLNAGLLVVRPRYPMLVYGLTDVGRREICLRDGHHDYDKDRPASDGCQTCDAGRCQGCAGFGSVSGQRGPVHTNLVLRCRDCDGSGLST